MATTVKAKPLEKDEAKAVKRRRRQAEIAAASPPQPPVPFLPAPRKYSLRPEDFFAYWAETDSVNPDRVVAYVYRGWPRIDRKKNGLLPDAHKYIDTIGNALASDPLEWRRQMLHRYGSGSYKLVLTDGLRSKSLCQTVIPSKDLDDDEYPPVLDLSELVMDHPDNQSYIRQLEIKGVLAKESEMQQGEAVKEMAGLVREVVLDGQRRQAAVPAPDPMGTAAAIQATAQAMADVSRMGNEMMKNAFTQVATATADQSSPKTMLEMLGALANIVAARKETKDNDPLIQLLIERETELRKEIAALQASLAQIQGSRITALEEEIRTSRANPTQPVAAPGSLAETLKTIRELREAAGELVNPGEEAGPKAPAWLSVLDTALKVIPAIGAMAVQASYNLALARSTGQGAGAGVPPQLPAIPAAIPASSPGPIPGGATMPDATGTTGQEIPPAYVAMVAQLEGPLARHLNEGLSGDDFANGIVQLFGLGAYRKLWALGKEMWHMLLTSRPLIAPLIQANPQQFEVFLDEFIRAEEIWAEEEAAGQTVDSAPVA